MVLTSQSLLSGLHQQTIRLDCCGERDHIGNGSVFQVDNNVSLVILEGNPDSMNETIFKLFPTITNDLLFHKETQIILFLFLFGFFSYGKLFNLVSQLPSKCSYKKYVIWTSFLINLNF